jgi:hypothetical protein
MEDTSDIGKKLDELDSTIDYDRARKLYKAKLVKKINNGDIGLLPELEQLKKLETWDNPTQSPLIKGENPEGETEYGIPDKLRVKRRPYTLTPAALAQRKAAASTPAKAEAMKGNKNAWKTGEHAQGLIRQIFRPCKSTCPQYPCSIVSEGETEPGEACLDKAQFVRSIQAVESALKDGKLDDFKAIAAVQIAGGIEVIQRLIADILEDGTVVKSEKWDKEGTVLGYELKNHPALPFLAKLMEAMNMTPQDMMATPLIIKKQKTEEKKAKGLADIMSGFGKNLSGPDEGD